MRSIVKFPDLRLKQTSKEITLPNSNIQSIISDMEYYLKSNAVGMAAIQLGEPIRLIGLRYGVERIFLINPKIVKKSAQTYFSIEGCLSLGENKYQVRRHKLIKVKAQTPDGKEVSYKGKDIFGAALQHEIDHLDGKLINDI